MPRILLLASPRISRARIVISPLRQLASLSQSTPSSNSTSPHEGLPRWPSLTSPTGCLRTLDWIGTVVFAGSGSLTAATMGADIFGCSVIGTITAIGGGTLRDVLVLRKQPFWVEEWEYLVISVLAASAFFFGWEMLPNNEKESLGLKNADGGEGEVMQWGDALGVGAFAVIGCMNGIRAGCPALVSSICGMMTSTFGGLTRDTLLNRPVRILHPYSDVYAPIAFTGAASYLAMRSLMPGAQGFRIFGAVSLTMALRYGAWTQGWRLPWWDKADGKVVQRNQDPRLSQSQIQIQIQIQKRGIN